MSSSPEPVPGHDRNTARPEDSAPRRSAPAIAMAVALIGALVLLAMAPFHMAIPDQHGNGPSDADWNRAQTIASDFRGSREKLLEPGAINMLTDGKSGRFAFFGRSPEGNVVLGALDLSGFSARTSAPSGADEISTVFGPFADGGYAAVWVAYDTEVTSRAFMGGYDTEAEAEAAAASFTATPPIP